jgi:hypothetical protein
MVVTGAFRKHELTQDGFRNLLWSGLFTLTNTPQYFFLETIQWKNDEPSFLENNYNEKQTKSSLVW